MSQKQKKQPLEQETADQLVGLKKEFEKVKETPATRTVILMYESCCGCGCDEVRVKRTVAYDSPLKDGDNISKMEKGDRPID